MKDKCSYADKYKAMKPPTCGCKLCNEKWNRKQKLIREGKMRGGRPTQIIKDKTKYDRKRDKKVIIDE